MFTLTQNRQEAVCDGNDSVAIVSFELPVPQIPQARPISLIDDGVRSDDYRLLYIEHDERRKVNGTACGSTLPFPAGDSVSLSYLPFLIHIFGVQLGSELGSFLFHPEVLIHCRVKDFYTFDHGRFQGPGDLENPHSEIRQIPGLGARIVIQHQFAAVSQCPFQAYQIRIWRWENFRWAREKSKE